MRREPFDTDKLQHYRLAHRILAKKNGLSVAEFDLLIYLNPVKLFTVHDFNNGTFTMSWDNNRMSMMFKEGWLKKVYEGRGYKGGHNKYSVTQKTKILVNKLGKILDGDDMPLLNAKTYSERNLNKAAKIYNNLKYGDEGIHS